MLIEVNDFSKASGYIRFMPAELLELLEEPHLVAALLVAAFVGAALERVRSRMRRHAWRERNRPRWEQDRRRTGTVDGPWLAATNASLKPTDAADQLRIVMKADFLSQPLLNKSEVRVFRELDRTVIGCNPGWQVMAQVSLGEILQCKDPLAHSCINSKRVDLLLVDEDCKPRHVIEYQGGGHYQGMAAARDAVKREALRRAGVGYHEVLAGHTTPSDLRRLVERLVERPVGAAQ